MGSTYDRNANFPGRPANLWIKYVGPRGTVEREPANTTNRAAAMRLCKMREKEVAEGTWKPRGSRDGLLVRDYARTWLANRRAIGVITVNDDETRLNLHILPKIGDKQLEHVARDDVRDLFAELMAAAKLAPKSIHNVYTTARAMFADAIPQYLEQSPCTLRVKKRELPRKRDKDPDFRSQAKMSRDEVELLMSAPADAVPLDRLAFYALEIFGGMRFGEAAGRKWAHYDPAARPLGRIRCATQYDGLELKGGGREREIPVHPVLAAILEEWRTVGFPALFGRAPKSDDWIVPSRLGRVRSVSHMYKRQAEDFERLGLRRRRQHDARRTLRSLCISGGANRGALDAITHRGSSTETGDAPGTYDSWEWPALCEAILCLKLDVTRRAEQPQAHLRAHFEEPRAYPINITHENWRGGRGSNPRPPA